MKVRWKLIELQLRHTFRITRSSSDTRRTIVIAIDDQLSGVTGLGEIIPYPYYGQTLELAHELLPSIVTLLEEREAPKDLAAVSALANEITASIAPHLSSQRCGYHVGAAFTSALLDLLARRENRPLMQVIDAAAGTLARPGFPSTSFTLGIDEPDIMKQKVAEAADFDILKIKLGRSLNDDRTSVEVVRSCTDKRLRVDANCGWDLATAVEMSYILRDMNVEFIEQPLPREQIHEYSELIRRSALPIIVDESVLDCADVIQIANGLAHGINIKLSKSGGPLVCLEMMHIARNYGLKVMIGSMIETSVGIGFAYHLSPFVDFADLDGNLLTSNDPFVGQGNMSIEKGVITPVASTPGLGIDSSSFFAN